MSSIEQLMSMSPVMAIFRNYEPAAAVAAAEQAWDLGIEVVEVPVQVPSALESLEAIVRAGAVRGKPVGAGTVTSVEQLHEAHRRGAAFTVAPGLDEDVVAASQGMDMPHLPGVSTPTEVQKSLRLGLTWLKAFPASVLGTEWFKAMQGPFPQVRFVATGGIDADNAGDFLAAGARTVAVGAALSQLSRVEKLSNLLERTQPA
jgi:2-dehydro-3-deoxyphosphogluconate aldolase/(4S)-4-hydroxy-2-oxoglutarate aldolase